MFIEITVDSNYKEKHNTFTYNQLLKKELMRMSIKSEFVTFHLKQTFVLFSSLVTKINDPQNE